ncbi:MAG: oxidative damage protection protein [Pseudomonadales bacterium]|nr:oxidative damage protection protein [Pseudomonadales bacterium]
MSNTVFCRKYQQELEALTRAPYPGPKGQDILKNISAKAWGEWTQHQTMLINEKQLSMMDPEARKFLQAQQEKFFDGSDFEQVEGYVPPEK